MGGIKGRYTAVSYTHLDVYKRQGQGYNTHTWQTVIVRGWMEELGAQRHIVAKDGTQSLTLPAAF